MSDATYFLTQYVSLYTPSEFTQSELTWCGVVSLLDAFTCTAEKFSVGGFGAHHLKAPPTPCFDHAAGSAPHRCARCVDSISLFVFDVDAGTNEQVSGCMRLLQDAGQAALFYSSHSHTPTKPAFRLLIPPTKPISPVVYPQHRASLIERFKIPCKPEQSSDVSRFWFMPSHPPGATPVTIKLPGELLDVDLLEPAPVATSRRALVNPISNWSPPPEPAAPFDLDPLRATISKAINRFLRAPDSRRKGQYLRRMLNGETLADHGSRNQVAFVVCGVVAFLLPGAPLSALMALFKPSLDAMREAGSKLTEDKVQRMFLTAMRKKAEADHEASEIHRILREEKARGDANLTTVNQ